MMGEGGERGRHREGQDESDDAIERMMKDITDEIEKELEREQQEWRDCDEDPDEAMRKAIKELEEEEEERRRTYEEYLGKIREKEEECERARQEREESADEDSLDEFEKKELERMRKRGEDPEDVLKRWREQYVREVEDYIGDTPETKDEDEREDVGPASEKPADDLSYFGDGFGQMYATKSEHRENTSGEIESESEKDTQSKEHENRPESTNPDETDKKSVEGERTRPEADEPTDSEPQQRHEASTNEEADESSMQKRTRREMVAEGEAESEMCDEAEPESPEKDSKKEFYNRPEEEWRRKYRERFQEREEEEKEEFREVLVDQIKEKEDVERLARKNDYEQLLEDEDAMEEIEEYLQTRKALENAEENEIEELAKELGVDPEQPKEGDLREILPESLKELLNREGDLLWRELDRKFIESHFPESIEELESSEIGQELEDILKEEAEAWIEIMAMRRENEIESMVRNEQEWYEHKQIRELSEKYGVDEEDIVRWLRFEEIPPIIREFGRSRVEEIPEDDSQLLSKVYRLFHEEGVSERKLSEQFDLSRNQVRAGLRDWDVHQRYYREGHTFKRIAEDLELTITTLRGIFRRRGWTMQVQTERPMPSISEIRRLHRGEGLNFKQIAERSGIELEKVRKAIGVKRAKSTEEEIGRLYFQEGFTFGELSEYLGVSVKTIRRAFKGRNWTPHISTTRKQLDLAWVHHLYYVEGFTHGEIAKILRVHKATINKAFLDNGWISRDSKSAKVVRDIDSERIEYQRKRRQELKDTRLRMFGSRCHACHSEKKPNKSLHLHRKDGTEHDRHLFRSLKKLKSLKPEEWSALCDRCHLGIHLLMKVFGFDWKRIEQFLEGRSGFSSHPKEPLELPDEDSPLSKAYQSLADFTGTKDDLKKELFGDSCGLCGCEKLGKALILHRKDGRSHDSAMTNRRKYLEKLNPSEWAPVCPDCHNIAQWALEFHGMEWPDLVESIRTESNGGSGET
jgi:hypothetical protein